MVFIKNNLPKIIAVELTTADIVYATNKTSHNYFILQIYQGIHNYYAEIVAKPCQFLSPQ